MQKKTKLSKQIDTNENWHPTAKDGKVTVSAILSKPYRVCVWGDDDYGMEMSLDNKGDTRVLYRKIVDGTTICELLILGFKRA